MKAALLAVVLALLAGCATDPNNAPEGQRSALSDGVGTAGDGSARVVLRYLPHEGERSIAVELSAAGDRAVLVSWRGFAIEAAGGEIAASEETDTTPGGFPVEVLLSPGTNVSGIVVFAASFENSDDLRYEWDGVSVRMSGVCRVSCGSAS